MLTKVLQGETFVFPMWRGQVKGFVRNDDDTAADDDYDHENHDNDDVCGALEWKVFCFFLQRTYLYAAINEEGDDDDGCLF